ncbi:MAG TPA: carbohydrate-binding protein, partial [Ohtaekwangia sp.]|nr:carbohydrate-binding protein [Ohtaekwangia sp.]
NDGYSVLLNYWQNGGTKPTVQFAKDALMQLAENLKIENNIYRADVIDAMFRQVNDPTTRPFAHHVLPGVVHLSDFDLGPYKKAYSDKDTATTHVSTGGGHSPWNNGWIYRNDGVDLENNNDEDPGSNKLNVGWTNDGEWMQYTVTVDSSAAYTLSIRYAASTGAGKIKLTIEGTDKTAIIDLPATGGNKSWATKSVNDVILHKGIQKIRVMIIKGGANLGFLKFALSKEVKDTPFQALTAETSADGEFIYISLNKSINPSTLTADDFKMKVNNTTIGIEEIKSDTEHPSRLVIKPGTALNDNDIIHIDYSGTEVQATDATPLEIFTSLQVVNNLPRHIALPGIVQAEDFAVNVGLELETTTDTGGGQNIGYTNAGDYLDYNIRVAEDGQYTVEVRVASGGAAGKIELQQLTKAGEVLHTATSSTPVTGGWQNWQTVSTTITLSKGSSTLRLKIVQPEFNVNWIKFSKLIINSTKDKRQGSLYLYPNPTEQNLHLGIPEDDMRYDTALCIRHITGSVVRQLDHFNYPDDGNIFVGDLSAGLYVIELSSPDKIWINKFIKK